MSNESALFHIDSRVRVFYSSLQRILTVCIEWVREREREINIYTEKHTFVCFVLDCWYVACQQEMLADTLLIGRMNWPISSRVIDWTTLATLHRCSIGNRCCSQLIQLQSDVHWTWPTPSFTNADPRERCASCHLQLMPFRSQCVRQVLIRSRRSIKWMPSFNRYYFSSGTTIEMTDE